MNPLLVVEWRDLEKVVVDLDDSRDEPEYSMADLNRLVHQVGALRREDPSSVGSFRLSELLLYRDEAAVMACLPYMRELAADGTSSDDCDEGPAEEFLRKFHPGEVHKLLNPGEGLYAYSFGYEGVWLENMLSDGYRERTERLLWLLERCGEEAEAALKSVVANSESLYALDLDERFLPPWSRHKTFTRCRITGGDFPRFAGCRFRRCEFVGAHEDNFWGCTFAGEGVPAWATLGSHGNTEQKESE